VVDVAKGVVFMESKSCCNCLHLVKDKYIGSTQGTCMWSGWPVISMRKAAIHPDGKDFWCGRDFKAWAPKIKKKGLKRWLVELWEGG
jgi:hypothetical protein